MLSGIYNNSIRGKGYELCLFFNICYMSLKMDGIKHIQYYTICISQS